MARWHKLALVSFCGWIVLSLGLPLVLLCVNSFRARSAQGFMDWSVSVAAYQDLFHPSYLKVLLNTLRFAIGNAALCTLCAVPLCLFLKRQRGTTVASLAWGILVLAFWSNMLVRLLAFSEFARLPFFGGHLMFQSAGLHLAALSIYLPLAVFMMRPTVEKLDDSVLEAAFDLGASRRQSFLHVTLPLLSPGIKTTFVFVFVPSMGEFLLPEIIGGGRQYLLGSFLQAQFLTARNTPLGSATLVVLLLVSAIIFWALERLKRERGQS